MTNENHNNPKYEFVLTGIIQGGRFFLDEHQRGQLGHADFKRIHESIAELLDPVGHGRKPTPKVSRNIADLNYRIVETRNVKQTYGVSLTIKGPYLPDEEMSQNTAINDVF